MLNTRFTRNVITHPLEEDVVNEIYNAAWESVYSLVTGEYNIWEDDVESVQNTDDIVTTDLGALLLASGQVAPREELGYTDSDYVCCLLYDAFVSCFETRVEEAIYDHNARMRAGIREKLGITDKQINLFLKPLGDRRAQGDALTDDLGGSKAIEAELTAEEWAWLCDL